MIGESPTLVKAYTPKDGRARNANQTPMELGERLRILRGHRTQRDLARDAGIDNGTLSRLERGELDPTLSTLQKIARALGISLSVMFSDDSTPQTIVAGATGLRLPEGATAQAIRNLQAQIDSVLEIAQEAKRLAEQATKQPARRGGTRAS